MYSEKKWLTDRQKIRTWSKRLVTTLSIILGILYIATLLFCIPGLSLHFTIAGVVSSIVALALNIWSLVDNLEMQNLNRRPGTDETSKPGQEKKLTKIYLDITSSASLLIGSIVSISLFGLPIAPFISTPFFVVGYAIMAVNFVRWLIDRKPKTQENEKNNSEKNNKERNNNDIRVEQPFSALEVGVEA